MYSSAVAGLYIPPRVLVGYASSTSLGRELLLIFLQKPQTGLALRAANLRAAQEAPRRAHHVPHKACLFSGMTNAKV